jgi:hypothetical protein
MDFENKKLETWRSGELLEEISFEKLREEGEAYMERLENANEEEEEEAVPLEEQKDVKK